MLNIEKIKGEVAPLAQKYNIFSVDLFGSYANGSASEQSDADFLVRFTTPVPSIFAVMGFKEELSRRLSLNVDVITLPLTHPDKLNIGSTVRIYEA